jgi:hypothetical protein
LVPGPAAYTNSLCPLAHPLNKPATQTAKNAIPPEKAFNFPALIESPQQLKESKGYMNQAKTRIPSDSPPARTPGPGRFCKLIPEADARAGTKDTSWDSQDQRNS